MYRKSEQMYPIIKNYLEGNISQSSICDSAGISVPVLQYWLKKYRSEHSLETESGFAELEVETTVKVTTSSLTIYLPSGARVEIPLH